ncbi:MAG: SdrD B-like domain-containing protein [Caldilineaceae bacterium]
MDSIISCIKCAFGRGIQSLLTATVAALLAIIAPAPILTNLAHTLFPASIADTVVSILMVSLPAPAPLLAAENPPHADPLPTNPGGTLVTLGSHLWLEDDYDGNAATGIVKPVGAGYTVTALASDGTTRYTTLTNYDGSYALRVPTHDTYIVTAALPTGMIDSPVRVNDGSNAMRNDNYNHNRLGTTVVVTATDNLSIDFIFFHWTKQVALGDRLWLEDDNDGDATTGTVTPVGAGHLVTAVASDGVTTYSGVTDANGYYLILVPENDTYTVRTDRPDGVLDTPVLATNGHTPLLHNDKNHERLGTTVIITETDNLSIDFGFFAPPPPPQTVNLGNYVWFDNNEDGIQNEPLSAGLDGITVTLTHPNGAMTTAVTASGGYYTFTQLLPYSTYTVSFGTPAGYLPTITNSGSDTTDSDPVQGQVVVALGDSDDVTIDAGFVRPVTVGDRVWYDNNHDGRQGDVVSEPGVVGAVATLYQVATEQPVLVNGHPLTESTDDKGAYLLTNLPPGAYFVVFGNLPAGYAPTLLNVGDDAGDSDADVTGRTAPTAFLTSGEEDRTLDMGIWQAPASLGEFVWEDENQNGVQDPGEPGLPGVTVTIQSSAGTTTTTTDNTGHYTFTNLLPGVPYTVTFTTPSAYTTTLVNSGSDDGVDSDGVMVGIPPLQPGEHNPTIDSGFVRLQPDLFLQKEAIHGAVSVQPGTVVLYRLRYGNQGNGLAVGAVITETVSAHTTFVAQGSTPGWSCPDGAAAGTICLFNLDNLAPGQRGAVTFAVQVDLAVAPGTAIANMAMISTDSNQVEGAYANNAAEVTLTTAGPTDLPSTLEPGQAAFRLYLPVINR